MPSDPDPSGDRSSPPPRLRTEVGSFDGGSRHKAIILLSDPNEQAAFVEFLSGPEWEIVTPSHDACEEEMAEMTADIIVTDSMSALGTWRNLETGRDRVRSSKRSRIIMVLDHDVNRISLAEERGAHVLPRPIDRKDPFGLYAKRWLP